MPTVGSADVKGDGEPTGWRVKAGRYEAKLVAPGELSRRLRSLLADLRAPDSGGPTGCIEVLATGNGDYVIRSDERVWHDSVPEADVPDQVVRMLLRAALDEERSLVHIHAGAVGLGDSTVVLAGWSASGKSTAIAALVGSGFSYVTDERLTVSADGRSIMGFPKPISLISGSFKALAHLDPYLTAQGASNDTTWQIPASTLGPVASQEFRYPSLLVFVTYRPDAALQVTRVAAGTAAARLLGDSPDVIERGRDGARAIVSLASSIPSIGIEYSTTDALVATIRDLLIHPTEFSTLLPTEIHGSVASDQSAPLLPGTVDTSHVYGIVDDVSVWIIEERALAYDHRTGRVVELDEASAVWLQLLDERQSIEEVIEEVAAAVGGDRATIGSTACQLVHALWKAGVIGPETSAQAG